MDAETMYSSSITSKPSFYV